MSGELTEFEQKSAVTPKHTPYGIIGGTVFAVILFILIGTLAQNKAVQETKGEESAEMETQDASSQRTDDIEL